VQIIIAMLVFSIIIFIHEFGHFIFARMNGIRVEEFAIGMGPKLFSKKKGDTLYSLRAFPIGGFCQMIGEDENSEDEDAFCNKGVFARFQVLFAGAFMNLVLGFVLLVIIGITTGYATLKVEKVLDNSKASVVGIQEGDTVIAINDVNLNSFSQIKNIMLFTERNDYKISLLRDGEIVDVPVEFKQNEQKMLGILSESKKDFLGSITNAFYSLIYLIELILLSLKYLFAKLLAFQSVSKEVAGPVGIIGAIGAQYSAGLKAGIEVAISNVLYLTALLSINLGVINLMPFPALDGGRIVMLAFEGIFKKPINPKVEGIIHLTGFVILMALMAAIVINDIVKLVM
jgi:regulator of sigma E protease